MEYIDKTKGALQAHSLLSDFLSRCKIDGFSVSDDLYSKMKSDRDTNILNADTTYNILKKQLLEESNNRCCYCMRNIKMDNDTTLEHIIPNKVSSKEEYNQYLSFGFSWPKVIFSKDFLSNSSFDLDVFPHTIAYENLIPSCNGKFAKNNSNDVHAHDKREPKCCNNKRGNKFIIPFVLNLQMVREFKYRKDGYVTWPVNSCLDEDERIRLSQNHKDTIEELGLNCPELVAIRKIWYFLSSEKIDCSINNRDDIIYSILKDEFLIEEEISMLLNFSNDNYWCLLNEYNYFNDISKFHI